MVYFPSSLPIKLSCFRFFVFRGGPTSTNGSPRFVTSNGLPVLATSAIAPRHLALNSPTAMRLCLSGTGTLVTGFFLLADFGTYGHPPDDHGHSNMVIWPAGRNPSVRILLS